MLKIFLDGIEKQCCVSNLYKISKCRPKKNVVTYKHLCDRDLLMYLELMCGKLCNSYYKQKSHPGPEAAQKRVVLITHEKKG